ncbi:Gfo/Idh/MocA family protein [Senegalia massiliensis]|uniref:Gfo/Idh/MocA family protein n=1 Tax=Senegalia massiliensis TaxID=1720316 RepID=UPI0010327A59|nr:Gfo/Idh/MocA family oxidoreductase [Senegalia massiliensis]
MDNIKYGIISTASIVPRFINAVKQVGKGEIIAIASRNINRAKEKAKEFKIPKYYGSYKELYEDKEVNVVYIATINGNHYNDALEALKHNKNVICEKPFTLKKEEAEHLFDFAKEKGLFIMEAQKSVFLPITNRVKKIIEDGVIGEVKLVNFTSSYLPEPDNWVNSKEAGGGALFANASYFLELSKYIFEQEILQVNAMSLIGPKGADSQYAISLKLNNDIMINSTTSYHVLTTNKALIYGELGYIEIPNYWKARNAVIVFHDGNKKELNFPCQYELKYEIEHIEECLKNNLIESPIMNRDMTVSTIGLMESISKEWN